MFDMIEPHVKKFDDVVVIECVKNLPALFAGADEAHLAKSAQLM